MKGEAPFFVRIAGLPAEAMEGFATQICAESLRRLLDTEEELRQAREDMVARLHDEIHHVEPGLRRFLLAVKRDCFNGRSLAASRQGEVWDELRSRSQGLADRIVALEAQAAVRRDELASAFQRERTRQRRLLVSFADDRAFLRGLSLASPVLVEEMPRLRRKDPQAWGRKEKGLEQSLLRYVSRAAFKTSPYSTFTRIALGLAVPACEEGGIQVLGAGWQERSLFRLKRFHLDQLAEALFHCPALRDRLRVAINNTIEEIEPGRFRYLRPGYWFLHEESGELRYFQDSLVKVSLSGPVFNWIRQELSDPHQARSYRELVESLDLAFPGAGSEQQLEKLLKIDFLTLLPPWPSHEDHLEREILRQLRAFPAEAGVGNLVDRLDRLIALEQGFPAAEDPLGSIEELVGLLDEIWEEASVLGGLGREARRQKHRKGNYYEDVFLAPAKGGSELARVPTESVERALRSLDPLVRLTGLYTHRHDFLHALAGLAAQRWPNRSEIGFLDLFSAAQPLWQQFAAFAKEAKKNPGGWKTTFDPFELPQVADLRALRDRLWPEVEPCVRRSDEGTWINPEALAEVVAQVPEAYVPELGVCPFLQPADTSGGLWVLNRLYEGTGRYGSRFAPLLDGSARLHYLDHMTLRSEFPCRGEVAEILDLFRIQGDTLNVHAVQTARVLETPGENVGLTPSRALSLRDLRVRLDDDSGVPRIVDLQGRWLLPVHLGGSGHTFMPTVIKFLSLFGPGDFKVVLPARTGREEGPMTVWERLVIGNVVLARKKWGIPPAELEREIHPGVSDDDAFIAINRWRLAAGIPDCAFVTEPIRHKVLGMMFKPQYLDFTSPLFVPVFRSALAERPLRLAFEEMLPTPEMYPKDGAGARWATELLLDSLAFRPAESLSDLAPPEGASHLSFASCGRTDSTRAHAAHFSGGEQ